MNNRTPDSIEKTAKVLIAILMAIATGVIVFGIVSYTPFYY